MAGRGYSAVVILISFAALGRATVFFEEKFGDGWESRWTKSTWKQKEGQAGDWTWTAGKFYADENDKGIQTGPDARFYAISAEFPEFSNEGKTLVLQFQVKHEQSLDCGGGYIKLLPGDSDMSEFKGETKYNIMFGPDICGLSTKKIHTIFNYKDENHLMKNEEKCETDQLSHVYTLVVNSDNTYEIMVDLESKRKGSLYDDWDMLPPKKIKDPNASKPEDWDDNVKIDDPTDEKPEGWDDIPKTIPDPDAEMPDDWDEDEDGEWEPPMVPNPEYKGEWKPKKIENPNYMGIWEAPEIDNPDFVDDDKLYMYKSFKYVGMELWQVKAGSIFDNILVTDDVEYAKKFAEETWGAMKDAEKAMFEKLEEERKAEEAKKAEEEEDAEAEDEDYEEEVEEAEGEAHDEL